MKTWKRFAALFCTAAMALSASACSAGTPDSTPSSTVPRAEGTSAEEKTLLYGLNSTWTTLMPFNHASSYSTVVWDALYEPLTMIQDDVIYRAASSIDVSEDFLHWTVHLNDKVTWSDGTPTTAQDWVFTFETVTNPEFGVWNDTIQFNTIVGTDETGLLQEGSELGIHYVDDYTFTIDWKEPTSVELFSCIRSQYWRAIPKHLLENIPLSELGTDDFWLTPVGNGLCVFLDEPVTGTELSFKTREDYYLGAPSYDYLTFKVVASANIPNAMLNGELDTSYSTVNAAARAQIDGQNGIHFEVDPYSATTQSLIINNRRFSKNVRKAFDMLIDKQMLADVVGGEGSQPVGEPYLVTMDYYLPYTHTVDVEGAKALLEAENFDFEGTVIRLGAADAQQNMAVIIQQNLAAAGIQVEIVTYEFSQLNAMQRSGEIDCVLQGNTMRFYAAGHMDKFIVSDNTYQHVEDPTIYNKMIELDMCTDPAQKVQLAQEVQRMFWEEVPQIFLYSSPTYVVESARVSNIQTGTMTLLNEIEMK